jgi:hypothetical protein
MRECTNAYTARPSTPVAARWVLPVMAKVLARATYIQHCSEDAERNYDECNRIQNIFGYDGWSNLGFTTCNTSKWIGVRIEVITNQEASSNTCRQAPVAITRPWIDGEDTKYIHC